MLNTAIKTQPNPLRPVKGKSELIADQLQKAKDAGLLITGLQGVWKHCRDSRGWVIIDEGICNCNEGSANRIEDAVENIIDEVMEHKGIVEIVDANTLRQYGQIVMIIKQQ